MSRGSQGSPVEIAVPFVTSQRGYYPELLNLGHNLFFFVPFFLFTSFTDRVKIIRKSFFVFFNLFIYLKHDMYAFDKETVWRAGMRRSWSSGGLCSVQGQRGGSVARSHRRAAGGDAFFILRRGGGTWSERVGRERERASERGERERER